jgi:protein-S-isoprenylcysteine O-methyltransferase Ste14
MSRIQGYNISKNLPVVALVIVFLLFVLSLLQHHSIFPAYWFPSLFTASAFTFFFCLWIFGEIMNNARSKKNSRITNQDKGSYWVVIAASWSTILVVFIIRSFDIGTLSGIVQYVGLGLFAAGIALREWAVWVLGKHFTVRVQVREKAKLVTEGPYNYIRHPAYTGSLLIFSGVSLAIGTWIGVLFALVVNSTAYKYRIQVEEEALQKAFGADYEAYKKRTWKLFP